MTRNFFASTNHNEVMNIDPIDGRDNKRGVSRDASGQRGTFGMQQHNNMPLGNTTVKGLNFNNFMGQSIQSMDDQIPAMGGMQQYNLPMNQNNFN